MKKGTKITISVISVIIIVMFGVFLKFYSVAKTCNENEVQIDAYWQEMQNVNSALVSKIKTNTKFVKNYKNSMIELLDSYMKKYKNDADVIMKWTNDAQTIYPDSSMWKDIMKLVESEYTSFQIAQKDKIDMGRSYKRFLADPINSMIANLFGKPSKTALKIMSTIIMTQETKDTFDSGTMKDLDLGLDEK